MNLAVARIAVTGAACAALSYTAYAWWERQHLALLITVGIFVICIPVDLMLRQAQRAREAATPFGPVAKWGLSEDAAHRGYAAVARDSRHTAADVRAIVNGSGWRAAWRRLTPWWVWVSLLAVAPTAVGVLVAPRAVAGPIEDYAFIVTLDEFGVLYSSEPAAIAAGISVCDQLDRAVSSAVVVGNFTAAGYDLADARVIVGAAMGAYCPQHLAHVGSGAIGGAVLR